MKMRSSSLRTGSDATTSIRPDRRTLAVAGALLFAAGAAGTVVWCGSMSAMGGMRMPGGWSMSMAWMRMPGQSWAGAAVTFVGMWTLMMVPMMLPSLAAMLARSAHGARLGGGAVLAAAGYFGVWTAFGALAYPFGVALAAAAMRWDAIARAVPAATSAAVLLAGCAQLTRRKQYLLACCRGAHAPVAEARGAFRHGLRLGVHCVRCCAGLMGILLAVGVMDLGAMLLVAAAVTAERVAPGGERFARLTGVVAIAAGAVGLGRALL